MTINTELSRTIKNCETYQDLLRLGRLSTESIPQASNQNLSRLLLRPNFATLTCSCFRSRSCVMTMLSTPGLLAWLVKKRMIKLWLHLYPRDSKTSSGKRWCSTAAIFTLFEKEREIEKARKRHNKKEEREFLKINTEEDTNKRRLKCIFHR